MYGLAYELQLTFNVEEVLVSSWDSVQRLGLICFSIIEHLHIPIRVHNFMKTQIIVHADQEDFGYCLIAASWWWWDATVINTLGAQGWFSPNDFNSD